jgi:hypothetical protein
MINDVFRDLLDAGTVVYIDDILIYSENEEEHKALVKEVLERLKKAGLCVSLAKSKFHVVEVEYLGYHISSEGISMSRSFVKMNGRNLLNFLSRSLWKHLLLFIFSLNDQQ